ncbi:MAG: hypothetical protein PVG51_18650 [Desulfosarcina sp.]|jgi:hypothetical protein
MKFILIKFLYFLIAFFIGFGTMLLIALPALVIIDTVTITLLGVGLLGLVATARRNLKH